MRVLVTGATGFIGRFLIPQLLQREDTAVTLLLLESQSGTPLPPPLNQLRPQYEAVYADLRNFQLTLRAVQEAQPDKVIHLAAVGTTDPFLPVEQALRHNVTGTVNLARACFEKTFNVNQMILARTPGERSAMNVYAASKAAAWQFARMYGRTQAWPLHGGMIFQAYGPGQPERAFIPAAFRAAMAGEDFPMTAGTQQRDWIFGADVAAGLAAMLDAPLTPGITVELGTGQATSLAEVAQLIYDVAGRGGRPLPGALSSRPGEEASQIANVRQTAVSIQWQAAISLRQGLTLLHQHYAKTG